MALVTLWFVSAAEPRTVLDSDPHADRGFARKYLAQLNPAWPLTHIGDFDMTRSTAPGAHEFYIGGYPGLSVIQTIIPDLRKLSELPERYRILVPAADVYATAVADHNDASSPVSKDPFEVTDLDVTYGGFAHWSGGQLKRSFCATRETVFEDIGLPAPFELAFWEGTTEARGIQLPFIPREAAATAAEAWLGFPVSQEGPEIPISAFAVDGRPEAKSSEYDGLTHRGSLIGRDNSAVGIDDESTGYDDYAARGPAEEPSGKDVARSVVSSVVRTTGSGLRKGVRGLQGLSHKIGDEVRRRARGN